MNASTDRRPEQEQQAIGSKVTGTVLVVDDNQVTRTLLSRLVQREGHRVAEAANGLDALAILQHQPVDVVLLDILMPGLNGYQVLERIKADRRWRHIPVIVISALDEMDSIVRCIELGAEDYLFKPYNPVFLRARLKAALMQKRLHDQEAANLQPTDAPHTATESPAATRSLFVLGIMQDAGLPQAGCRCATCRQAVARYHSPRHVASLGVLDSQAGCWFLIDATPDFRWQVAWMQHIAPNCPLAGILITHAHMGHYTGLLHLGLEAWHTHRLPVWTDERLAHLLQHNAPWSQLLRDDNIQLHTLSPMQTLSLTANLQVTAVPVPHRNEWSHTFAFLIESQDQRVLYCPDTDHWDGWEPPLESWLSRVDLALLDGTFFSPDEIPHRDPARIPHPFIAEHLERLQPFARRIWFTHLNHTNPLLVDGAERHRLKQHGFDIAEQWASFPLDE